MDALILAGFVLAVLALTLTFVFVGVAAYVLYRYVVLPWRIMRTDMQALSTRFKELEATVSRAEVMARSDADIARAEARLNARQRVRMEGVR
jgi:hypothetical protein